MNDSNGRKGRFISIEGPEGAGKTTLISGLAAYLQQQGVPVLTTREPGGIEIAERIRAIILDPSCTAMDPRTEALLYAAARRQHLAEKVVPALRSGIDVICDRYVDSSLAYQGYARGLGIEEIRRVNEFATGGLFPDVTLLLDISPEEGLRRIAASKQREVNRLDQETIEFHRKVREGYLMLLQQEPKRIRRVDASAAFESVLEQAIEEMERGFNLV